MRSYFQTTMLPLGGDMVALLRALAGSGLLIATTVLAQAADPVKLRVADSFPKGHFLVKLILEPWMEAVTRRTNGAVSFEHYPAQQLGKAADMLKLTQTGVADIGYVAPAYVSEKMPVSEVAMLPGAFAHACQGTLAYWKLAKSGVIAEQDYAGNNIRLLLAVSLPQYRIFTVKNAVKDVSDVAGLKLRSTGGAQDLTLRALGAVPVRMAAPDAYESLTRGTMDGLLFAMESVVAYGMDSLIKYTTDGVSFGSFIVAYSINQSAWDRLPDDVKRAMDEASEGIVPKVCAEVDKELIDTRAHMQKSGVTFVPIPEDTRVQMKEKLKGVGQEWATTLDARGKPASAALKEFNDLLVETAAKK